MFEPSQFGLVLFRIWTFMLRVLIFCCERTGWVFSCSLALYLASVRFRVGLGRTLFCLRLSLCSVGVGRKRRKASSIFQNLVFLELPALPDGHRGHPPKLLALPGPPKPSAVTASSKLHVLSCAHYFSCVSLGAVIFVGFSFLTQCPISCQSSPDSSRPCPDVSASLSLPMILLSKISPLDLSVPY